jgi:hypothetical protein
MGIGRDLICDMNGLSRSGNEKHAKDSGSADAWFIAHARTDVPELVAEVRRLQENAQKVADLLADADAVGGEVSAHNIMVALRGGPYGSEDGL